MKLLEHETVRRAVREPNNRRAWHTINKVIYRLVAPRIGCGCPDLRDVMQEVALKLLRPAPALKTNVRSVP